jgi:hypothetical protein
MSDGVGHRLLVRGVERALSTRLSELLLLLVVASVLTLSSLLRIELRNHHVIGLGHSLLLFQQEAFST